MTLPKHIKRTTIEIQKELNKLPLSLQETIKTFDDPITQEYIIRRAVFFRCIFDADKRSKEVAKKLISTL